jgi:hypothetical protein
MEKNLNIDNILYALWLGKAKEDKKYRNPDGTDAEIFLYCVLKKIQKYDDDSEFSHTNVALKPLFLNLYTLMMGMLPACMQAAIYDNVMELSRDKLIIDVWSSPCIDYSLIRLCALTHFVIAFKDNDATRVNMKPLLEFLEGCESCKNLIRDADEFIKKHANIYNSGCICNYLTRVANVFERPYLSDTYKTFSAFYTALVLASFNLAIKERFNHGNTIRIMFGSNGDTMTICSTRDRLVTRLEQTLSQTSKRTYEKFANGYWIKKYAYTERLFTISMVNRLLPESTKADFKYIQASKMRGTPINSSSENKDAHADTTSIQGVFVRLMWLKEQYLKAIKSKYFSIENLLEVLEIRPLKEEIPPETPKEKVFPVEAMNYINQQVTKPTIEDRVEKLEKAITNFIKEYTNKNE